MTLQRLSLLICTLSLFIISSQMLAMEQGEQEPRELTDVLPAEAWNHIASYLPGDDRWLNEVLMRRILDKSKITKENYENIAKKFLYRIALMAISKDSWQFDSRQIERSLAHYFVTTENPKDFRFLIFPRSSDLAWLAQQHFDLNQKPMHTAMKKILKNEFPDEHNAEFPTSVDNPSGMSPRLLFAYQTFIDELGLLLKKVNEPHWIFDCELRGPLLSFVKPDSGIIQGIAAMDITGKNKIAPEVSQLRELSFKEKITLKLLLRKYLLKCRSLAHQGTNLSYSGRVTHLLFKPLVAMTALSYFNQYFGVIDGFSPQMLEFVNQSQKMLITMMLAMGIQMYSNLITEPSSITRPAFERHEKEIEKLLADLESLPRHRA